MKRTAMFIAIFMAAAFIGFTAMSADAVHKGSGSLSCGGCHTMHNTQGSTTGTNNTLGGDASWGTGLLLRGTTTNGLHTFCLDCHADNGGNNTSTVGPGATTPPKVFFNASASVSAGGNFYPTLTATYTAGALDGSTKFALGYGHSVGDTTTTNPTPPGGLSGMGATVKLTCTSCHDPHGAPVGAWSTSGINLFRNLKTVPTGSGGVGVTLTSVMGAYGSSSNGLTTSGQSWAGTNSTLASHTWPVADASRNNIYGAGPTDGDDKGIAAWCSECHDNWHEANVVGNNKDVNDWKRHPVDNRMVDTTTGSNNLNLIVDWAAYITGVLPAADTSGVGSNSAIATGKWYADNQSDKVFCLSCHYAHGGPYLDALRWDYLSAATAGNQTPNGVATGAGCNVCHNK